MLMPIRIYYMFETSHLEWTRMSEYKSETVFGIHFNSMIFFRCLRNAVLVCVEYERTRRGQGFLKMSISLSESQARKK